MSIKDRKPIDEFYIKWRDGGHFFQTTGDILRFAEAYAHSKQEVKQVSERLYVECPNCNGMGYITDIKSTTNQHFCNKCNGSKYILKEFKC